jgi:hypothetical protein
MTEARRVPRELGARRRAVACPKCAKHRLVAIDVVIGDDKLTMRSCCDCGARWWEREGCPVTLPQVLELAAAHR